MTRREIALYKLASFSEKMQKRAEEAKKPPLFDPSNPPPRAEQSFSNTIGWNAPTLGLLGLTGLATGGLFGGEEGKWKRRLLAMLGLPATYAALLAAKKNSLGGLMPDQYGISGPKFLDKATNAVNKGYWGAYDGVTSALNTPKTNT